MLICTYFHLLIGHRIKYYWIGAIQTPDAKGAFQWYGDVGRFSSGLFYSDEPNQVDRVNRQCINVGVAAQEYKMNDYPCESSLAFICEKGKDYSLCNTCMR